MILHRTFVRTLFHQSSHEYAFPHVPVIIFICIFVVENRWCSIDVIYYEYGALVLLYTIEEVAARAFSLLRDSLGEGDKPLQCLLLPHIQVSRQHVRHVYIHVVRILRELTCNIALNKN